jgi:SAM-dependent methyltransferase
MYVDWYRFAEFLTTTDRARVVREAWQEYAHPYGAADDPARRTFEQRLAEAWSTGTPLADGVPADRPDLERLAAQLTSWTAAHMVADAAVSRLHVRIGGGSVVVPSVIPSTVDGVRYLLHLHADREPLADRHVAALLALLARHDTGGRRPAVLDAWRGRLVTGDADPDLLTQAAQEFSTMWTRFDRFATRVNIYSYLPPGWEPGDWDMEQIGWEGVRQVTDVGCGAGRHLRKLAARGIRALGVDPSVDAVRRAARETAGTTVRCVAGDLADLPVASGSSDVVLAMHMLYNLDDLDRGLREVRRILRPGGRFLATTSAPDHLGEFGDVFDASVRALHSGRWDRVARPGWSRFDMDTGYEPLAAHFPSVERRELVVPLVIPDPEPVIRYLDSTRSWRAPHLPTGLDWNTVMAEVRRRVIEMVRAGGPFKATIREGAFVCRI